MKTQLQPIVIHGTSIQSVSDKYKALDMSGRHRMYRDGYKGQDVIVAIPDTGVNEHAELAGKLYPALQFCHYSDNAADEFGHGTHVAGTIAGGTCGIAPACKILPVKVLDKNGSGDVMDLIQGLRYLLEWRAPDTGQMVDIVSMSLACEGTFYDDIIKALWTVIQELTEAGIIVICAAGNTGEYTTLFPASFPEVITVGAVDDKLKVAYFSTKSEEVDVCQVGVNVVSCGLHTGYVTMSGTSMATPAAAGIAALMISKHKAIFSGEHMTVKSLYDMLKMTTIDVEAIGIDHETGAGFATFGLPVEERLMLGRASIFVNGIEKIIDVMPIVQSERVFTPARHTHESLGDKVDWLQDTQEVVITRY